MRDDEPEMVIPLDPKKPPTQKTKQPVSDKEAWKSIAQLVAVFLLAFVLIGLGLIGAGLLRHLVVWAWSS